MRQLLWLSVLIALTASLLSATVNYHVTPLGGNLFQYDYSLSGLSFQAGQELDIRFDPTLYGALSNGIAPAGYTVTLLQPNNPLGSFGDYSAMVLINNPDTTGPFSVQFTFLGSGQPGSQPFFINEFDQNGFLVGPIASGFTSTAPEPATLFPTSLVLLLGAVWWIRRTSRKRRRAGVWTG